MCAPHHIFTPFLRCRRICKLCTHSPSLVMFAALQNIIDFIHLAAQICGGMLHDHTPGFISIWFATLDTSSQSLTTHESRRSVSYIKPTKLCNTLYTTMYAKSDDSHALYTTSIKKWRSFHNTQSVVPRFVCKLKLTMIFNARYNITHTFTAPAQDTRSQPWLAPLRSAITAHNLCQLN